MPRFVPIRTSLSDDNDNYTQIRIVVKWQARYSRANTYLKKSMGYNSYFAGNKLCNNLKLLISRKFICACPAPLAPTGGRRRAGEEIIIAKAGKPIAKLVPIEKPKR